MRRGAGASTLAEALRARFPATNGLLVSAEQPEYAGARVLAASANVVVLGTRETNDYPVPAGFVNAALGWRTQAIAVALAEPYDSIAYRGVPTALASYVASAVVLGALGAVLAGEVSARGRLPATVWARAGSAGGRGTGKRWRWETMYVDRGFFRSLFDFSFDSTISGTPIRYLYALRVLGGGVAAIFIWVLFVYQRGSNAFVELLVVVFLYFVFLVIVRFLCESMMTLGKIADYAQTSAALL